MKLRKKLNKIFAIIILFLKQKRYHFVVWGTFIGYEVAIAWLFTGYLSSIYNYILHYFFNILLFYVHSTFLLKTSLDSGSRLTKIVLPIFILLEISIYITVVYGIEVFLTKYCGITLLTDTSFSKAYLSKSIWRSLYFIGFSTGYYFLLRNQQRKLQVEEMKQQKLKSTIEEKEIMNELMRTQNAYLKAQINPHFLINTLSFLYNETRKLAPKAAESILSLSDILQYSLSREDVSGQADLEHEIALLENFLSLHQARQVRPSQLNLYYDEACLKLKFIPLVLMTLTENMLKHGNLEHSAHPASIIILYREATLQIKTTNLKSVSNARQSHSIGLQNIADRLRYAYGDQSSFEYYLDADDYFHTAIKVII